jgi:hypothetical protein
MVSYMILRPPALPVSDGISRTCRAMLATAIELEAGLGPITRGAATS